ncbi:hypothetical protein MNEG_11952, partial [Monoraphidium neglectum]
MSAVVNATITVVRWTVGVPAALWALRLKSREQWAADWAGVKKTVKHEAHHYWVGTKLLATDVRIASGLAFKAMRGNTLTRRERRQLTRTTADIVRLVPMIVILLVPFMELALPVLLKIFPNMLPSTFEDKMKKPRDHHPPQQLPFAPTTANRSYIRQPAPPRPTIPHPPTALTTASQLSTANRQEEDVKKRLVVKLEVARFLQ